MVTNLRDAKGKLSQLVQLAAEGEEVVITVRGEPRARLVGIHPAGGKAGSREQWAAELAAAAEAAAVGPRITTPQEAWDDLREERA